jgi:hypothetical protein
MIRQHLACKASKQAASPDPCMQGWAPASRLLACRSKLLSKSVTVIGLVVS